MNTQYFNKASVIASTTNNYTGIFDMSGGAWEYMMSGVDDGKGQILSGNNSVSNSGFNGDLIEGGMFINGLPLPSDSRYYDKYSYDTASTSFQRRILGDASGELGPFQMVQYGTQSRQVSSWYDEEAFAVYSDVPWVMRGGCFHGGIGVGIFDSNYSYGQISVIYAFRITLAF